jgi:hypothetical protein
LSKRVVQAPVKQRKPPQCRVCGETGHNRISCKTEKGKEKKERRSKITKEEKEKEDRGKRKEGKAKEAEEEKERLGITKEKKSLYQPSPQPGRVKEEHAQSCMTV